MKLITGDCVEEMKKLDADSIDAIVTDPPYGLEFMGKDWDKLGIKQSQDWHFAWAVEAFRVAKPGAHLVAFGGTRTFHRLTCALEDAGWEIRDCLMWLYGTGFPKSHNVSKGIDKAAGAERVVIEHRRKLQSYGYEGNNTYGNDLDRGGIQDITIPTTKSAKQWDGWGTALKPAWEPIILARKPLIGTVASENFEFVGIDKEKEYVNLAQLRIDDYVNPNAIEFFEF